MIALCRAPCKIFDHFDEVRIKIHAGLARRTVFSRARRKRFMSGMLCHVSEDKGAGGCQTSRLPRTETGPVYGTGLVCVNARSVGLDKPDAALWPG